MLDLPENDPLFPPETVWLRRILRPDGSPWRSSRDADVLLLGDSFSNIYSLESMGWGTSAGFAEQLSYVLRRPVDRLVQNDEGAFATRTMLQREPDRLTGKRVVVYQFSARELAFGDWRSFRPPADTRIRGIGRRLSAEGGYHHAHESTRVGGAGPPVGAARDRVAAGTDVHRPAASRGPGAAATPSPHPRRHSSRRVRTLSRQQRPALLHARHPCRSRQEVHLRERTPSGSGCSKTTPASSWIFTRT